MQASLGPSVSPEKRPIGVSFAFRRMKAVTGAVTVELIQSGGSFTDGGLLSLT